MKELLKRLICSILFLCIVFVIFFTLKVGQDNKNIKEANLVVFGDNIDAEYKPFVEEDGIYIAVDTIKKLIDENIYYDKVATKIIVTTYDKVLKFKIDENKMSTNFEYSDIKNEAKLLNNAPYIDINLLKDLYNINVEYNDDSIHVFANKRPNKANIKTMPYPGFPTDLQPQIGVCLALANGTSIINEGIWDSRFQYTAELNKMGANITAQGKSAIFEGVKELYGAPVEATDLRAGAALIIAGIVAKGETSITNLVHIDRGYENIEEKFRGIGANIQRVVDEEI